MDWWFLSKIRISFYIVFGSRKFIKININGYLVFNGNDDVSVRVSKNYINSFAFVTCSRRGNEIKERKKNESVRLKSLEIEDGWCLKFSFVCIFKGSWNKFDEDSLAIFRD